MKINKEIYFKSGVCVLLILSIFLSACSKPTFVKGDSIKLADFEGRAKNQNYKGELIWFFEGESVKKIVNGVTHELIFVEAYIQDNSCAFAVDGDVFIARVGKFESVNGVIINLNQIDSENGKLKVLVEIGQPILIDRK